MILWFCIGYQNEWDRFCSCLLRRHWAFKRSCVLSRCSLNAALAGRRKSWQHTLPWKAWGLSACICISVQSQSHQCCLQDLSDRIQKPNDVSQDYFQSKQTMLSVPFLYPCSVRLGRFVLFSSSCYMKYHI